MTDRSNAQWIADLSAEGDAQAEAINDLKHRLERGIYYYLGRERSDLAGMAETDLQHMAQDLAQDAVLRVIGNLDSFRGDSQFTTWATRIAVRVAISDLRRARYRDFSLDELTAEGDFLPLSASPLSGETPLGPERAVEQGDMLAKIQEALSSVLTERQFQALYAVAVLGVSMDVVAHQLDTNRNALYKLLHDARRKLRQHFEAQGLSMDYLLGLFQE
jgi:RNA polymerase sigma-70 factor (ECF subfamily)